LELRTEEPVEGEVERTDEDDPLRTADPDCDLATEDEVDPLRTVELEERTVLPPVELRTAVEPPVRTAEPERTDEVDVLVTASAEVLPTRVAPEDLLTAVEVPVAAFVVEPVLEAPTRLTLVETVPIPSPRRPPTVLVLGVHTPLCPPIHAPP